MKLSCRICCRTWGHVLLKIISPNGVSYEGIFQTVLALLVFITILISSCGNAANSDNPGTGTGAGKTVEYSPLSTLFDGQMTFMGVSGGIDGVRSPTLSASGAIRFALL